LAHATADPSAGTGTSDIRGIEKPWSVPQVTHTEFSKPSRLEQTAHAKALTGSTVGDPRFVEVNGAGREIGDAVGSQRRPETAGDGRRHPKTAGEHERAT
jgi:hypothetical protein